MEELQKTWESKSLIRFPDCDPFNHLNNSRYLDYFINAREDHLLKFHHFNIYELAREKGISWVVSKNQIVYLRPALLMETVVIQSTLGRMDEKEILVEMSMWNSDKTILKLFMDEFCTLQFKDSAGNSFARFNEEFGRIVFRYRIVYFNKDWKK
jgi:acyl-CoA thioester hydrolase